MNHCDNRDIKRTSLRKWAGVAIATWAISCGAVLQGRADAAVARKDPLADFETVPKPAADSKIKMPFSKATAAQWSGVYSYGNVRIRGRARAIGVPKMTPKYEAIWNKAKADAARGIEVNSFSQCLPNNMPHLADLTYPGEIIFRPDMLNIIYEFNGSRRIFMDGRRHPDYVEPNFQGHSIGWWEGDTLVIDTVGVTERATIGPPGMPHSASMHITERMTGVAPGVLRNDIHVEDPEAFPETPQDWTVVYLNTPSENVGYDVCEYDRNEVMGINK